MKRHLSIDEPDHAKRPQAHSNGAGASSPDWTRYLETINKSVLDFDFEKTCSVTLSQHSVYACLVCGKYFQGRSQNSVAYQHSINQDHHVFINLTSEKVYVLPENEEVSDSSKYLDIRYNLNPKFTEEDIKALQKPLTRFDLNHNQYTVGYVGLNNVRNADYCNVVLQVLSHIGPLRDYLLRDPPLEDEVSRRFGLLVKRIWSMSSFKSHVSPHDFMQIVPDTINSPVKFLVWFLNSFSSGVVKDNIQGVLLNTSTPYTSQFNHGTGKMDFVKQAQKTKKSKVKFWVLSLNLPVLNENSKTKIPEVELTELLSKYNGRHETYSSNTATALQILSPPPFLILSINREVKDDLRGNPTVVKYPLEVDFSPFIKSSKGTVLYRLVASVSRKYMAGSELDHSDDKQEFSVSLRQGDTWRNFHDLEITKVEPELLFLEESVLQVWERI